MKELSLGLGSPCLLLSAPRLPAAPGGPGRAPKLPGGGSAGSGAWAEGVRAACFAPRKWLAQD